MLSYKTKSGAVYSLNSDGWKRNSQNLRDACYVQADVARKALEICKKGVSAERVFEQCKKIRCSKLGGVILYEDSNGKFKFSSEIVSRQPIFSLEDSIIKWLEEVEPEDEERDEI